MLTARSVRRWYRIHKWTSLICTTFLLMSCITGLPMIFSDDIEHLLNHPVKAAALPESAPPANLDSIVQASQQRYPKLKLFSLGWDDDEPRIFVNMSGNKSVRGPRENHSLFFDPHTGAFLEEAKEAPGFMKVMNRLHVEIYAGTPGEIFLGCMALLFVVALTSGAIVYGPFTRNLDFGTVRKNKTSRVRWFDLHNLIGIVTLSWAMVVGVTGIVNTLSRPLFNLWRSEEMPRLLEPYRGKPLPTHLASVDVVVQTAETAFPDMNMRSVVFPNRMFGSPQHYLVWMHGKTPASSQLFTPILIDAQTGRLTTAKGLPWYLHALEVSRPLHFGDYGGLPLKIIWALFDVALILVLSSGVYLWLSRRKTPVERELNRLVTLEELSADEARAAGASA